MLGLQSDILGYHVLGFLSCFFLFFFFVFFFVFFFSPDPFLPPSHPLPKGLQNLVVITGDPPKMGDYPKATAVFDLDSITLLHLINGLNRGVDPAGKVSAGLNIFFFFFNFY